MLPLGTKLACLHRIIFFLFHPANRLYYSHGDPFPLIRSFNQRAILPVKRFEARRNTRKRSESNIERDGPLCVEVIVIVVYGYGGELEFQATRHRESCSFVWFHPFRCRYPCFGTRVIPPQLIISMKGRVINRKFRVREPVDRELFS